MLSGCSSRILKVSRIDDMYRSTSGTNAPPPPPPPAPLADEEEEVVPLSSVILRCQLRAEVQVTRWSNNDVVHGIHDGRSFLGEVYRELD